MGRDHVRQAAAVIGRQRRLSRGRGRKPPCQQFQLGNGKAGGHPAGHVGFRGKALPGALLFAFFDALQLRLQQARARQAEARGALPSADAEPRARPCRCGPHAGRPLPPSTPPCCARPGCACAHGRPRTARRSPRSMPIPW
ncbi:hypothetical protein GO496_06270 [Acidovorax citrulli]|nr:hypothetical protein [Paracidovorax citrulli]